MFIRSLVQRIKSKWFQTKQIRFLSSYRKVIEKKLCYSKETVEISLLYPSLKIHHYIAYCKVFIFSGNISRLELQVSL